MSAAAVSAAVSRVVPAAAFAAGTALVLLVPAAAGAQAHDAGSPPAASQALASARVPARLHGRASAQAPAQVPAQASAQAPIAGRIVFAIGQAEVVSAAGARIPATDGAELRAGERVVTGPDAYVHLRMVDQAFIAVRPDSTLEIDLYDYDAAEPQASRIRLQLDTGNARTVSGRGGEAARDRYRFNTPIAAIGLRGTDYTVRALDDDTRVSVRRGAVAVTPLGVDCRADALGPCAGAATRELSAGLPHAYLQVSTHQPVPSLITPEQDPAGGAAQNPADRPVEPNAQADPKPKSKSEADDKSTTTVAEAPTPAAPEAISAITVDRLLGPAAGRKLVWGRWSGQAEGSSSPPVVALLGPRREITYANAVFGLLRDNTGPVALPAQGTVGFRLDGAEAWVANGGGYAAASVLDGHLGIDFRQRIFDTSLAVQHAGGLEDLHAKGAIQASGLFASDAAASSMTVRGALARDASEAAYLFDKPLPGGGGLLGAVRWVR